MNENETKQYRIRTYLISNILIKSEIELNWNQRKIIRQIIKEYKHIRNHKSFSYSEYKKIVPRRIFYSIGVQVDSVYFQRNVFGYIVCIRAKKLI